MLWVCLRLGLQVCVRVRGMCLTVTEDTVTITRVTVSLLETTLARPREPWVLSV